MQTRIEYFKKPLGVLINKIVQGMVYRAEPDMRTRVIRSSDNLICFHPDKEPFVLAIQTQGHDKTLYVPAEEQVISFLRE